MSSGVRANHWPVLLSLLVALSLEVTPVPAELMAWRPPWLALIAIYWALAYPRRYGLALAWSAGLVLDVLKGGVLGQHALAMTIATWLTLHFHLRLRVFPVWQQTMAVGAVVIVHEFIVFWVDGVAGDATLGWDRVTPVVAALIAWPLVTGILHHLRFRLHMPT